MTALSGRHRPLCNRVTPFGDVVAVSERGGLMGNRGCLHDADGNIVRRAATARWISCLPTWPGICRQLLRPGSYTELFFLDEATALAAGHRPCGSCRPEALHAFKAAWTAAHGLPALPSAAVIDGVLDLERRQVRPLVDPSALAGGSMVQFGGDDGAWLIWRGRRRRWSFAGYSAPEAIPAGAVRLLTPPAIALALASGYPIRCDLAADSPAGQQRPPC